MRAPLLMICAAAVGALAACGNVSPGGDTGGGANLIGTPGGDGGSTGPSSGGSDGGTDAGTPNGQPDAGTPSCVGGKLSTTLGTGRVLVGADMADATSAAAPFDLRAQYIAGGIGDSAQVCTSCGSCTSGGHSCSLASGGCNWWGCWQDDTLPPGQFVRSFVANAQTAKQLPVVTYYEILQASGATEGAGEVAAANDTAFMQRYLADWRFLLQTVGTSKAMLHIEPDFWGYAEQVNADPHATPAAVASANPTDCAAQENSIAGLGRCMIAMTRKYAPNALVSLHASGWGTKQDVLLNRDPALDVTAEAQKEATFLLGCGAAASDFIAVDAADRDAGYYQSIGQNTWWDPTNATLPSFHQAFAWGKALTQALQLPVMWWQLPYGNMSLSNTTNSWKDNRVDYFFNHLAEASGSNTFAVVFGAGRSDQTQDTTDGGHFVSLAKALFATAGEPLCAP